MFELDRVRRRALPPASIVLGALTLVVYAIECVRAAGTAPGVDELLALGASEQRAIWERHELWRLLCPAFLHASVAHIAMNGYSFVQLAPFVERVWGWSRFLVVYVVSAVAGAALSSRSSGAVSVGASGALFGLMGFLVVAAYSGAHRHEVRTIVQGVWGQGLLLSVGGVLFYGFSPLGTHIDNMAHVGGLVAGALLGLLLVETEEDDRAARILGVAAGLAVVLALGMGAADVRRGSRFDAEIREAQATFRRGDFVACADACERALTMRPQDSRAALLMELQGEAFLRAGKLDDAVYALERAYRNAAEPEIARLLAEANEKKGDLKAAARWRDVAGVSSR